MAESPKVSFIVPCYMHGHFLAECVESILEQSFRDFEILVMDDCSPDETPAIARSFTDARVIHVRNEQNLGHLANYNKGLSLARGTYIWLINVDDYLRRPYVLERFVGVMERVPSAAYVFCSGISVRDGQESPPHAVHSAVDRMFGSNEFLTRLLEANCVPTPAAMVRKSSYDRVGGFAPDLPYSADWLQWCSHAFYGAVAFMAEPMVCYRIHDRNMTKSFLERPKELIANEVEVRWRVLAMAERLGFTSVAEAAVDAIADDYGRRLARWLAEHSPLGMTMEEFASSLRSHAQDADLVGRITARVLWSLADDCYRRGDRRLAARYYREALRQNPRDLVTWVKRGLLATGPAGRTVRAAAAHLRQHLGSPA